MPRSSIIHHTGYDTPSITETVPPQSEKVSKNIKEEQSGKVLGSKLPLKSPAMRPSWKREGSDRKSTQGCLDEGSATCNRGFGTSLKASALMVSPYHTGNTRSARLVRFLQEGVVQESWVFSG